MSASASSLKCTNECVHLRLANNDTSFVKKSQDNFKKIVGKNVKSRRLQAALSQEELAERCGIFRTYLSRIESGLANPTLVVLVALAYSLEMHPHELLIRQP
jgi:ribosome-binding protein aMBF1 (putative translation factor)